MERPYIIYIFMLHLIDNKIRKAFSNAAFQYDILSSLHKEIGRELAKKVIDNDQCASILDIGMGTGWLTKKIAFYFPESRVIGIDFADGMVEYANKDRDGFDIIQADALKMPFQSESFDIIVSNLAFQWIADLPKAFSHCYNCLTDNGKIFITMFGYETFRELFESLENGKQSFSIKRLEKKERVAEILEKSDFKNIHLDYERIKVHFPNMNDLVKWIKDIGANTLPKELYVGKELLAQANEYYDEHFRDRFGIYATFEVIWIEANK